MLIYLKLLLMAAFWGGTFVAGRMLAGVIPPVNAALLRFALASAVLLILLRQVQGAWPRLTKAGFGAIVLLGLTGVFGYNVAFFTGLETVEASRAGLIIALNPVGITLLSALLRVETLRPVRALGVVISVVGALLVISRGELSFLSRGIGRGELMLLGCVLCWSLYSVLGRRAMTGMTPLTAVTYSALAGTLFLMPVSILQGVFRELGHYSLPAYLSIVYLAICGTVISFIWYYQAIRYLGTVRSGVFINFVPLFAMLSGVLILDEALTPSLLQGALLVIVGAWITNNDGLMLRKELAQA